MEFTVEYLAKGTAVHISKAHRFGTDGLLLAAFCKLHRNEAACDLGSGCGIIPLKWQDMGHLGRTVALEIEPEAVALLQGALAQNKIQNIVAMQADLRTFFAEANFDLVSCNPPYFTGGFLSKDVARATARHELSCTMRDIAAAGGRLLKTGGRLCVCQRPERMADVFCEMRAHKIEPKRLRMVRQRKHSLLPWLILVEGKKGGRPGLHMEPDLVIEDENGAFCAELLQIYGKEATK